MGLPLDGIRVLDLTRVLAGPFATMTLGDLGADVWKLEPPGTGDDTRGWGPPFVGGESTYFLSVNRNKRSLTVDLKHPEGRSLACRLAGRADVLVENFRPGTAERLGLGWDDLAAEHTRLVYCSISGFGQTGPDRNQPGYDVIVQGEAGVSGLTGEPDGPPVKCGLSIADLTAGLYAVQGILAALLERERTGRGRRIDVAMLDAMASLLTYQAGIWFATGADPPRMGNGHPSLAPYTTYPCADGSINVGVASEPLWRSFTTAIGRPELGADPRFATARARVRHRRDLDALVAEVLGGRPRAEWIARLREHGIPCGEIRRVSEVCESPQLRARGMIVESDHPDAGRVRSLANPVERRPPRRPPPRLGEHTGEILGEVLGLGARELERLRAAKVVA